MHAGHVIPLGIAGQILGTIIHQGLCLSIVMPKSSVKVGEEETEAATTTAAFMTMRCRQSTPPSGTNLLPFLSSASEDQSESVFCPVPFSLRKQ